MEIKQTKCHVIGGTVCLLCARVAKYVHFIVIYKLHVTVFSAMQLIPSNGGKR